MKKARTNVDKCTNEGTQERLGALQSGALSQEAVASMKDVVAVLEQSILVHAEQSR